MAEESDNIEKKYFSIGEVAEMLNVNPSLIRFWESEFDNLAPRKNKKGNRIYTEKDIETLKTIYYLVKERGFTLKGAKDKLKQNPKELEYEQKAKETLERVRGFLVELRNSL